MVFFTYKEHVEKKKYNISSEVFRFNLNKLKNRKLRIQTQVSELKNKNYITCYILKILQYERIRE